jgi:hypothetical protein
LRNQCPLHSARKTVKFHIHTLILLKTLCAIIAHNLVCQLSQYWFTENVCNNYLFVFLCLLFLTTSIYVSPTQFVIFISVGFFFWHIKYVGLQNLIQRNEQSYGSGNTPSGGVALPFILVQVNKFSSMFCSLFVHNRPSESELYFCTWFRAVLNIYSFACRPDLMLPWKLRYQKICSWCILTSIGEKTGNDTFFVRCGYYFG